MLKRIDTFSDARYYYDTDKNETFISATSFCSKVLGESPFLVRWKQELGVTEARVRAQEYANYGTFMHMMIEEFMGRETLSFSHIRSELTYWAEKWEMEHLVKLWTTQIKNDILAFSQFAYEKKLQVDHMERQVARAVKGGNVGIAGTIDFEGSLMFNGKRKDCILDYKSGRKGFYESHELQLNIYKWIIDGDEDLMLFNWSPKRWNKAKTPTYNFKNQTDTAIGACWKQYLEIGIAKGFFQRDIQFVEFQNVSYGKAPNFEVVNLEDALAQAALKESN